MRRRRKILFRNFSRNCGFDGLIYKSKVVCRAIYIKQPETGWGSSSRIVDWTQRNDGTFILQSAPTAEELATFDGLVNRDLLVQAYETAEATVAIQVIDVTPGTANGREVVEINVKSNLLQDGSTN